MNKNNLFKVIVVISAAIVLIILLPGCYNSRKAAAQFSRAAVFDPKLPADYCAVTFPPKNTVKTDTIKTTDTIQKPGTTITDTLWSNDTIRINTITVLPGKVITNTIHVTDTIYQENTAALRSCEIDKSRLVAVIGPLTEDRDGWKKKAKTRFWIILGMGAVIGIGIYSKVAGLFKPKLKV